MFTAIAEKPIIVENKQSDATNVVRVWDMNMDDETQGAIDKILDYLARHNVSPNIQVKGNLVTAVSTIIEQFSGQLPNHLDSEKDVFFKHMIRWISDYAQETNLKYLDVSFSFKQREAAS